MNGSTMKIAGEDALRQNIVETKRYIEEHSGVQSFNGRSGSVLPMAGDYSAEQVNYDSNQTVKQKIDALVTKEASDIAGQQSLLKDTVGWTGKNLLKLDSSYTDVDISMNIQSNGVTVLNGTSTGVGTIKFSDRVNSSKAVRLQEQTQYIFSVGDELNGVTGVNLSIGYSDTNGQLVTIGNSEEGETSYQFTLPASAVDRPLNVGITVKRAGVVFNNITLYPMIRRADITDPTYEPYHESVEEEIEQIYVDNGVLGAKNLLENGATSQTINGVTFTVNADGSVTVNGTATARINFTLMPATYLNKYGSQKYKSSGVPSGGSSSTYFMYVHPGRHGSWDNAVIDYGKGMEFEYDGLTEVFYAITIMSGTTVSNLTFKPMLRLASDPDDTYQPYAMTNRELTEKKVDKSAIELNNADLNDITETGFYYIRGGCTNVPDNIAYLGLKVQKNSDSNIHQMVLGASAIYARIKTGSPATWSSWYKFTGTVVS